MTTAAATVDQLRKVVDILDAHPDLPAPTVTIYSHGPAEVSWYVMLDGDHVDQAAAARQIIRTIGGTWDKNPWGDRFDFEQRTDTGISLTVAVHREQVCERIVTGTEQVTIPAVEAQPERVEVRELVEWKCAPLLAGAAS